MHATLNDTIILQDAPSIPGLHFRHFRGESDFPKMVEVLEGCKVADKIEGVSTVEDVTRMYADLKNCNPYEDMVMAEVNGQVIGYNRVTWWAELDGPHIYGHFGFLLPEWRNQGIGRALLHWSEARLLEIAKGHPDATERFYDAGA